MIKLAIALALMGTNPQPPVEIGEPVMLVIDWLQTEPFEISPPTRLDMLTLSHSDCNHHGGTATDWNAFYVYCQGVDY